MTNDKKIIITYYIGFFMILVLLVVFILVSRYRNREKTSIDYKLVNVPQVLSGLRGSGYIKFAANGSLLPVENHSSKDVLFTYEAVNRPIKDSNIEQMRINIDSLKTVKIDEFIPPDEQETLGATSPIWCVNPGGKNLFYYYRYEWPREVFRGDFIYDLDNNNPDSKSVKLENLTDFLSTEIIRPQAAICDPDGNILIVGEKWIKSESDESSDIPSRETGYAVIAGIDRKIPEEITSMRLFELKDKFRHKIDIASIAFNQIAAITFDMEDSSDGILVYRYDRDFSDYEYGSGKNSPICIRKSDEKRKFEGVNIQTDPIDNSKIHAFWIEQETGYDIAKVKHDIIAGEPGQSYYTRSLMMCTSNDGCLTFSEPVKVNADDIYIDGGISVDSSGGIYAGYFCYTGERYETRIRCMEPGESDFSTRYIFVLGEDILIPLQPNIIHVKKSDGSDRIIIVSKVNEPLDADFYLFALDKTI